MASTTSLGFTKPLETENYTVTVVNNNTQKTNDLLEKIKSRMPYDPYDSNQHPQLADKDFVNSSIQTATSNFRGNWTTWSNVPTDVEQYPVDYLGNKTPSSNDYLIIANASDYSGQTLVGTWRFKYTGVWSTNGKNGWHPEYQVNETPMTQAQLNALNSGITSQMVQQYNEHINDKSNPHNVTAAQIGLSAAGIYRDQADENHYVSMFNGIIIKEDTGEVPDVPLGYLVGTYLP